jgi:hypothetical protein
MEEWKDSIWLIVMMICDGRMKRWCLIDFCDDSRRKSKKLLSGWLSWLFAIEEWKSDVWLILMTIRDGRVKSWYAIDYDDEERWKSEKLL